MRATRRGTVRRALSAVGATIALGSAGCLGANGQEPDGPDGTPRELVCEEEAFRRLEVPFSEESVSNTTHSVDGEPRFELALDGRTIAYGGELRVALRNLTSEPQSTGARQAFAVQRETEAGWQDVRGTTDGTADDAASEGSGVDTDAVVHDPGEGFVWEFTLTESGIAKTHPDTSVSVCPPLGEGRYRFVYWGVADGAIAGEFEIVGPG